MLLRVGADGRKVFLKGSDEAALEELGYAASLCEHGHVNTGPAPYGAPHRGCPHFFRITDEGRRAVAAVSG